ncbi:MAG: transmembrane glucosamine N-acetyltransferase NagX, partial [Shewanella sp.]
MSTTAPELAANVSINAQVATANKSQPKPRLMSLDALRGFDMFWILGGEALFGALLIFTGWAGWQWGDTQMHHSEWHGFRLYDLIFPLFIFLSGVALGLSPKRLDKLPMHERLPVYRHGVKRLFLLLLLGILYNHGWGTGAPADPDQIRYASVLGRIAFAWFFAALLVWHTSLRTQVLVALGILVGYGAMQLWLPFPGGQA